MTRALQHIGAAARRVWRQQWRLRRTWLAMPSAAVLASTGALDATRWSDAATAVMLGAAFALAITTIGTPGDDLASGASAQDLLAGTPPSALIIGSTLGALAASLLGVAAAVVPAVTPLSDAPAAALMLAGCVLGLGLAGLTGLFVLLGTLLTGRTAAALTVPLAFAGFLPGAALPLDRFPAPIVAVTRSIWDALPLPHHVVTLVRAIADHQTLPHFDLIPLAAAVVLAPAAASAVLRVRIIFGRWA